MKYIRGSLHLVVIFSCLCFMKTASAVEPQAYQEPDIPSIEKMQSLLEERKSACADTLSVKFSTLNVLLAQQISNRLVVLVGTTKDDAADFAVLEISEKEPEMCTVWYLPVARKRDLIRESIKYGGFNPYLYQVNFIMNFKGWWNSGKQEFLVIDETEEHENTSESELVLTRGGVEIQRIPSGMEFSGEEQDWMKFSDTFRCSPDLKTPGKLILTCRTQRESKPDDGLRRIYCWDQNQLKKCD